MLKYTRIGILLNDLEQSDEKYYVGVDYAGLNSNEYSIVSAFTKDEEGSYIFKFTKMI
ncbi:hypothetical protein NV379_02085 [Paenibacillus sp. N1-5-1-14]|uniref:hypothetical protein n=1 Tax=Paenibacillus radicibacter TaxID=2972488 RepID=UPI002158CD94|nr:hypothetical protein [Paenibacillus radicibacter]MCR8641435.1 hypothetical protein [Paenibacillus radicibacter]